jgi:hypothetical protein
MTIDHKIANHVMNIRTRAEFCHQATLSIYAFSRWGIRRLPGDERCSRFAHGLQSVAISDNLDHYRITRSPSPRLYDVFAVLPKNTGMIHHSAIIVDTDPHVTVASMEEMGHVSLVGLELFLKRHRRGCDIFLVPEERVYSMAKDIIGPHNRKH